MSQLRIFGQVGIEISMSGDKIPLALGGVKEVMIVQNAKTLVPQMRCTVYDLDGTLHDLAPADGTIVGIGLDEGRGPLEPMSFRLCGGPKVHAAGTALSFTMSGYLNSMTYMREQVAQAFTGSSSDVISQLASQVGLIPKDIAPTNDSQVWLPQPISYAKFIQSIANHGYADGNSVMATAVTERGELLYKNITQEMVKPATQTFWNLEDPGTGVWILHWEVLSQAAVLNHLFGYGTKIIEEQLEGAATTLDKYVATLMNGTIGAATDLIEGLKTVRNVYVPPNAGNTHENFMQAKYQNLRGAATFTGKLEIITNVPTGVELYDPVETQIVLPHTYKLSPIYSNKFLVTAKTRCMRSPNTYYEKIELSNQG